MLSEDIGLVGVYLPEIMALISAGTVATTVFAIAMCICCKKSQVPQHRAKVMLNVVAEEEMKFKSPWKKRRGRPQAPPVAFDGTAIASGRWNDLTNLKENEIPEKFRNLERKPISPSNPPDVIMHPALLFGLRAEQRGQPQSTAVLRSPVSPGLPSSGPVSPPSTSLEELMREHREESNAKLPQTPLSKYQAGGGKKVQEKNKDGIIQHNQTKHSVNEVSSRIINEPIPLSRVGIRPGDVRSVEDRKSSQTTPDKKDHDLSRHDRSSGKWDNVPKQKPETQNLPPLPPRKYLEDDDQSNSENSKHTQQITEDEVQVETGVTPEQVSSARQTPIYRPHQNVASQSPILKSNIRTPSPRKPPQNMVDSPQWSDPDQRYPGTSESRNSLHGSENLAFVLDSSPQRQPPRREGRDFPLRHNDQRYRQQREDFQQRLLPSGNSVDQTQYPQRHRHLNDRVSNFDHTQLTPGVYLRPKQYYARPGMQDASKRYSDASDYSDLHDQGSYCDGQGNSMDSNPYFFRSRWSLAPDSLPNDYLQRRNSEFITERNFLYPRDQQRWKQQIIRSQIDNEQYAADVIKNYQTKPEKDGKFSPGYYRQSDQSDQSPSSTHHARTPRIPPPPRSSATPPRRSRSYHPRLHPSPSDVQRQEMSLPEVPFQYSLQDQASHVSPRRSNRNVFQNVSSQMPLDVVQERYHEERHLQVRNQPPYPDQPKSNSHGAAHEQNRNLILGQNFQPDGDAMLPESIPSSHLAAPNGHPTLLKRTSSDYGSLFDVMYRYRQNVRNLREKEKPAESPESRLRFEREKLKAKLKKELEPHQQASKNLDLIVATLLHLCESDNGAGKRSLQKNRCEQLKQKSRPSSAHLPTPSDEHGWKLPFDHGDVINNSDDYATIRRSSLESLHTPKRTKEIDSSSNSSRLNHASGAGARDHGSPENVPNDLPLYSKIIRPKPRFCNDFHPIDAPKTAPPDSGAKEFAFPSEDELNRILSLEQKQLRSKTPPPVPPRRNKDRKSSSREDTPSPASPRGSHFSSSKSSPVVFSNSPRRTPNKSQRDTPPISLRKENIPVHKHSSVHVHSQETHNSPEISTQRTVEQDESRRRSSPSAPLTESERQWLQQLGGQQSDVTRKSKIHNNHSEQTFKSTGVRRGTAASIFPMGAKMSTPSEIPIHEEENSDDAFTLDDIESNDAEDIIKEVERRMSERTKSPNGIKSPRQGSPAVQRLGGMSGHDISIRGGVTTKELPPAPPRRVKFRRSEGKYSSSETIPPGSPVFYQQHLNTPPLDGRNQRTPSPPIPLRRESLSPVAKHPVFQTPPPSPLICGSSPITILKKASSAINIAHHSPGANPRIQPQPPVPQFTPRKQPSHSHRPTSPLSATVITSSSAPVSPAGRPRPIFTRRSSKHAAKLPFLGKRFLQTTSEPSLDTEKKGISRTGEIILLPNDDDYADPFDCITHDVIQRSVNRNVPYSQAYASSNIASPQTAFPLARDGNFFSIPEDNDYDYAVPINSSADLLLRHMLLSRSQENLSDNLDTAV